MTDQLKPLPCAYCRTVPNVNLSDDFFEEPITERWAEKGCFVCHQFTGYPIAVWNEDQEKLLELRRKDFEAGVRKGILGFSDMAQDTFLCAFDDITCSELRDKMFDDYIKGDGDE